MPSKNRYVKNVGQTERRHQNLDAAAQATIGAGAKPRAGAVLKARSANKSGVLGRPAQRTTTARKNIKPKVNSKKRSTAKPSARHRAPGKKGKRKVARKR